MASVIFCIVACCFVFTYLYKVSAVILKNLSTENKFYNINLVDIERSYWDKGSLLFRDKKYEAALEQYLMFMFWRICGVTIFKDGKKVEYTFSASKEFYDKWGGYEAHIQFYGNIGRCLEYSNISKKELKSMVLNMPLEEGLNFPFTPEDLLPYYLKAYNKHKREKRKFEREYGKRYLIGGKIN